MIILGIEDKMQMNRTSQITITVALALSAIGTISSIAYYVQPTRVQPTQVWTEVIDADHYVQDLRSLGIQVKLIELGR
jgi:hypothetical protein